MRRRNRFAFIHLRCLSPNGFIKRIDIKTWIRQLHSFAKLPSQPFGEGVDVFKVNSKMFATLSIGTGNEKGTDEASYDTVMHALHGGEPLPSEEPIAPEIAACLGAGCVAYTLDKDAVAPVIMFCILNAK